MPSPGLLPDEQVYLAQAACLRQGGYRALRDMADEYVEEPTLQAYPSPLRWMWFGLASAFGGNVLQFASVVLVAPLVFFMTGSAVAASLAVASPLLFVSAGRRLQDAPVALATLAAMWAAAEHSPLLAVQVAFLLLLKEGALYSLPALGALWLATGGDAQPLLAALALGILGWAMAQILALGPRRFLAVALAAKRGHATDYSAQHQRGAPHRLLADLFLASPLAFLYAVVGAAGQPALALCLAVLLGCHAIAPVRNARLVLAGDALLRVIAASAMRWPLFELPLALGVDLWIAWRLRTVLDPTTATLTWALGMSPPPQPHNK